MSDAATAAAAPDAAAPCRRQPATPRAKPQAQPATPAPKQALPTVPATGRRRRPATDPGEDAYTQGFHLWEAGNYDQAIGALRVVRHRLSQAPSRQLRQQSHRPGLLDKGDARAAATALLANYRNNPGGERAPDSLFYLGQALMKLGQPVAGLQGLWRARCGLRREDPARPQEARERREGAGELRLTGDFNRQGRRCHPSESLPTC